MKVFDGVPSVVWYTTGREGNVVVFEPLAVLGCGESFSTVSPRSLIELVLASYTSGHDRSQSISGDRRVDGPIRISYGGCLCLLSLRLGDLAFDLEGDAVGTWNTQTSSVASHLFRFQLIHNIIFKKVA